MSPAPFMDAAQVAAALGRVGIAPGDKVMLHVDALAAAQFPPMPQEDRLDALIDALEAALGPEGTLVMPTFTYSFTRGEVYDPLVSPSQVGLVTERFRRRPGVLRSADPLFSVAAKGPQAALLTQADPGQCFGPDSFFARLYGLGGKIACLGCTLQVVTFLHYVERCHGVGYRFDKEFSGQVAGPQGLAPARVVYFARDLERDSESVLAPLHQRLEAAGLLGRTSLGRVGLICVTCHDFFDQARALLDERPLALIKEGQAAPPAGGPGGEARP